MDATLKLIFTQDRDGKPLATVRNFPGLDADLYPRQLRALAGALLTAADECEARPYRAGYHNRAEKSYKLTEG